MANNSGVAFSLLFSIYHRLNLYILLLSGLVGKVVPPPQSNMNPVKDCSRHKHRLMRYLFLRWSDSHICGRHYFMITNPLKTKGRLNNNSPTASRGETIVMHMISFWSCCNLVLTYLNDIRTICLILMISIDIFISDLRIISAIRFQLTHIFSGGGYSDIFIYM